MAPFPAIYDLLIGPFVRLNTCACCKNLPLPISRRAPSLPVPDFPVDLVYTWVDGADPEHAAKRRQFLPDRPGGSLPAPKSKEEPARNAPTPDGTAQARFRDNDELRYSLRSVARFLPWVRRIFIVTDNQSPLWLDTGNPRIAVIDHKEIIPKTCLPTFNSHVIEAWLHRIPGLAEHYIYTNDDVFFSHPCSVGTFFTGNGLPHIFTDWRKKRWQGYAQKGSPHAWSFHNTLEYMVKKSGSPATPLVAAHGPFPQTKSNAIQAFAFFREAIVSFSPNRFRTNGEMGFYCHALPIWAYALKKAVPVDAPFYYINTKRPDRRLYYRAMLQYKEALPPFFCLNDVQEKRQSQGWRQELAQLLDGLYPDKSEFEK